MNPPQDPGICTIEKSRLFKQTQAGELARMHKLFQLILQFQESLLFEFSEY